MWFDRSMTRRRGGCAVPDPADDVSPIGDANNAFPDCDAGAVHGCPQGAKAPCVKQIRAATGATQKIRSGREFDVSWGSFARNQDPPLGKPVRADNILRPSSSPERSLTSNVPVVLVRGCKDVMLEAD